MPQPTDIKLRTKSRVLEVRFDDGSHYELPFEYLRVFSPSAEVKGHGGGEGVLQRGDVEIGEEERGGGPGLGGGLVELWIGDREKGHDGEGIQPVMELPGG